MIDRIIGDDAVPDGTCDWQSLWDDLGCPDRKRYEEERLLGSLLVVNDDHASIRDTRPQWYSGHDLNLFRDHV